MTDSRKHIVGPTERERIARIIDPEAWAELDAKRAGVQMASSFYALERVCAPSLTKADAILASDGGGVTSRPVCLPEGYVAVPREATEEMWSAGVKGFQSVYNDHAGKAVRATWFAMLAARPDLPEPTQDGSSNNIHAKAKAWLEGKGK